MYQSDYEEDEDELDEEPSAYLPEEPRVVKTVRPARLRVFGRDFKQKDFLKSEASEEVQSGRQAKSSRDGAVAQESNQGLGLTGVTGSVVGADNMRVINDEVEQSWPAGHFLTGSSKKGSSVAPLSDSDGTEKTYEKKSASDYNSVDSLSIEEVIDQQWPPLGTVFSEDSSASFSRDNEASNVGSSEIDSSDRGDSSNHASSIARLCLLNDSEISF